MDYVVATVKPGPANNGTEAVELKLAVGIPSTKPAEAPCVELVTVEVPFATGPGGGGGLGLLEIAPAGVARLELTVLDTEFGIKLPPVVKPVSKPLLNLFENVSLNVAPPSPLGFPLIAPDPIPSSQSDGGFEVP